MTPSQDGPHKTCSKCGLDKPLADYYKRKDRGGYRLHCKSCYSAADALRYAADPAKYLAKARAYAEVSTAKVLHNGSRQRARKAGIEFTISVSDVVVPDVCPVLGIPLRMGVGKPQRGSPSLDRVDNALGYVPGNVRVISHRANTLKSDMDLSTLDSLRAYMRGEL